MNLMFIRFSCSGIMHFEAFLLDGVMLIPFYLGPSVSFLNIYATLSWVRNVVVVKEKIGFSLQNY